MRKNLTIFLMLFIISATLIGQSYRSYADYVASVRTEAAAGTIPSLPYDFLRGQDDVSSILSEIDNTLNDSLVIVRRVGYQSLDVLHRTFDETIERQQIIGLQFKGLEDPAYEIQSITLDNLSELDENLFTSPQRARLIRLVSQPLGKKETLLELVGRLGDPSAIPAIREHSRAGNPAKVRWSAYLALARLGDESAIATVEQKVRGLDVNSEVVYSILPGIIYTYQKPLYDYLVEELNSDERNCEPADPDQTRPINCAFRILEMLAPKVEGFPIGVSASGDLDTRNYRQALQTAREWFATNPNYQIITANE